MDRRQLLLFFLAVAGPEAALAQNLGQVLGQGLPRGLTKTQAEGGLREALTQGAVNAVLKVGKTDGYWGDNKIRIPLPGVLGQTQRTLKNVGLAGPLDDLQHKVNGAAETAAPAARDMFVGAIRSMTVEDVVGLLRGGPTSGTDYLKRTTSTGLTGLFRPPMSQALNSTGAIRSLDRVVASNRLGGALGKSPSDTLTDFAVGKGLDGLFFYVGEEEKAIRTNPAKRTTDLLKKTFGGL
jgi:hypothetical protein